MFIAATSLRWASELISFYQNFFLIKWKISEIYIISIEMSHNYKIQRQAKVTPMYTKQERNEGRYAGKGYRQLLIDNYFVIFRIDEAEATSWHVKIPPSISQTVSHKTSISSA